MFKRQWTIATVVLVVGLVFTAGASASRAPTAEEKAELTEAAEAGIHVAPGYFTLTEVRISTLGPWAAATLNHPFRGEYLKSLALYRERAAGWKLEASGSAGICVGPSLSELGLPRSVGFDLGLKLCNPPHPLRPEYVFVAPTFGSERLVSRPHRMPISGDGTFALYALRWGTWGGKTAVATGRAYDRGCTPDCAEGEVTRPRVKVRLSHRVECAGVWVYTRLFHRQYGRIPVGSRREGTVSIAPPQC